MRIDWDSLKSLPCCSATQIANIMLEGSNPLNKLDVNSLSFADRERYLDMINAGCVNPLFRVLLCNGFGPGSMERVVLLGYVKPGKTNPDILHWAQNVKEVSLKYANNALAFMDIDVMAEICAADAWSDTEFKYRPFPKRSDVITVDVPNVYTESVQREWFQSFLDNYSDSSDYAKNSLYAPDKRFKLWIYLANKYGKGGVCKAIIDDLGGEQ